MSPVLHYFKSLVVLIKMMVVVIYLIFYQI